MYLYETTIPIQSLIFFTELFVDDFNEEVCIAYLHNDSILITTINLVLIEALENSRDIKPIELTVTEQIDLFFFGKGIECYWGNIHLFFV